MTITNPDKVYFPEAGHTKLDLVRYYLAVADGALVGVRGRPMALKRFVDGAAGDFFFQKRAPENRPDFLRVATLSFPSGRTADEIVLDEPAGLAWVANLGCIDLNPHPVRADDLDHPDELRIDLDPVPGVPWSQIREVALVAREALDRRRSRRLAEDVRVARDPHQRPDRARAGRTRRFAARRWRSPATSSAGRRRSRPRSGGRRSATASSSTTTRTPRTGPSRRSTRSGRTPDARVSMPLAWDEVPTVEAEAFTAGDRPGDLRRARRSGGRDRRGRRVHSRRCSSCRPATRPKGSATRRGRRRTASSPANHPGSSRRSSAGRDADYDTPEAEAEREKSRAALERRWSGTRPTPTGRRRSSIPVIEISRAARKDDALAGSSDGRRAGRRPPRRSSRPTSSSTRCAAARRRGPGSGST